MCKGRECATLKLKRTTDESGSGKKPDNELVACVEHVNAYLLAQEGEQMIGSAVVRYELWRKNPKKDERGKTIGPEYLPGRKVVIKTLMPCRNCKQFKLDTGLTFTQEIESRQAREAFEQSTPSWSWANKKWHGKTRVSSIEALNVIVKGDDPTYGKCKCGKRACGQWVFDI